MTNKLTTDKVDKTYEVGRLLDLEGLTIEQVALRLGMSVERVTQINNETNPLSPMKEKITEKEWVDIDSRIKEMRNKSIELKRIKGGDREWDDFNTAKRGEMSVGRYYNQGTSHYNSYNKSTNGSSLFKHGR